MLNLDNLAKSPLSVAEIELDYPLTKRIRIYVYGVDHNF